MLRQQLFWTTEKDIPLMALNRGFIDESRIEITLEKATELPNAFTKALDISLLDISIDDSIPTRIITKDVERTFSSDIFRTRMSKMLTILNNRFEDYHQGLSFLVSFLMLFHEDQVVLSIAERLNYDEEFIPGYWKHEAIAFAVDAYVFDHLLSIWNPKVHAHLAKASILPATYPQKWFVALCVHVLPFDALFLFLKSFFARGVRFLFQFGLALFEILGPHIIQNDNPVNIFAYLRLDFKVVPIDDKIPMAIVKRAKDIHIREIEQLSDLTALRKEMYLKHLGKKYADLENNNPTNESDEYDFSDEEDMEAEPGSECQICFNMVPDYWCYMCKQFICGLCVEGQEGSHVISSHRIVKASSAPASAFEPKTSSVSSFEDKPEVLLNDVEKLHI